MSFRPVPLSPVRLRWLAVIAEFRWNEYFCDEQESGPFHYFRHCHRIHDEVRGGMTGSVVTDDVEYELPLGTAGDAINALVVKRQIGSLFAYRQRRLLAMLAEH